MGACGASAGSLLASYGLGAFGGHHRRHVAAAVDERENLPVGLLPAIGKGAGPVAARQCTGRPPCRRIRRFRRILPDAPGDLLDRPAALPSRGFGRPLPARHHSGATPSAAKGLREAHWTGSGGHGVEPGPAPMPARKPASRPPECLIADSGFGETSRARTTRAQRQRGVPRVAGRWGRKVALGAGRVLETRG